MALYTSTRFWGLYHGCSASLMATIVRLVTTYMSLGSIKNLLGVDNEITLVTAQCVELIASYPFVVALTCLRGNLATSLWDCFAQIIHKHGFLALWSGIFPWMASKIVPLVLSEIVDNALERINEQHQHEIERTKTSKFSTFLTRTFSFAAPLIKCAVYVGAACPFEVIAFKRHAQLLASAKLLTTPAWSFTHISSLYSGYLVDCAYYFAKLV